MPTDIGTLRKSLRMIHGAQIDSWSDWKVRDFIDRSKQSLEIRERIDLMRAQAKVEKAFDFSESRMNQDAYSELGYLHETFLGNRYCGSYYPNVDYVQRVAEFKRRHSRT